MASVFTLVISIVVAEVDFNGRTAPIYGQSCQLARPKALPGNDHSIVVSVKVIAGPIAAHGCFMRQVAWIWRFAGFVIENLPGTQEEAAINRAREWMYGMAPKRTE